MDELPKDLARPKRRLDSDVMGIIVGGVLILVLIAMIAFVVVT